MKPATSLALGAFALGWIQPDSSSGLLGLIGCAIDPDLLSGRTHSP
jgi:hypothetical protein